MQIWIQQACCDPCDATALNMLLYEARCCASRLWTTLGMLRLPCTPDPDVQSQAGADPGIGPKNLAPFLCPVMLLPLLLFSRQPLLLPCTTLKSYLESFVHILLIAQLRER
jgi:hypothetical protein